MLPIIILSGSFDAVREWYRFPYQHLYAGSKLLLCSAGLKPVQRRADAGPIAEALDTLEWTKATSLVRSSWAFARRLPPSTNAASSPKKGPRIFSWRDDQAQWSLLKSLTQKTIDALPSSVPTLPQAKKGDALSFRQGAKNRAEANRLEELCQHAKNAAAT